MDGCCDKFGSQRGLLNLCLVVKCSRMMSRSRLKVLGSCKLIKTTDGRSEREVFMQAYRDINVFPTNSAESSTSAQSWSCTIRHYRSIAGTYIMYDLITERGLALERYIRKQNKTRAPFIKYSPSIKRLTWKKS